MDTSKYKRAIAHEINGGWLGIEIRVTGIEPQNISEAANRILQDAAAAFLHTVQCEWEKSSSEGMQRYDQWKRDLLACFTTREDHPANVIPPVGYLVLSEAIPNQYSNAPHYVNAPWFKVLTTKGEVTLGPRKRVIEIRWDKSSIQKTAHELFPNENVTKDGKLIHAWGIEKAKEYIRTLMALPPLS